jgi:hypothetical protein
MGKTSVHYWLFLQGEHLICRYRLYYYYLVFARITTDFDHLFNELSLELIQNLSCLNSRREVFN